MGILVESAPLQKSDAPIPDSRFPIPDSLFPVPCSLFPTIYVICQAKFIKILL
ncbi:hypothetical protein [Moorena sp. SIO3H5]|uniref:hypothetical protein n=1 Tax=Moorena sp. SIO3H5 TaxID=2607834 RepID=UPI0013BE6E15|nr:hypothetical protein [Moorena sp. SIO3H5]NEO74184.1 hypothetical protein [Moorena sp. SIO3H5]